MKLALRTSYIFRRTATTAVDLLFPRRCYGCKAEGRYLCGDCFVRLPRLEAPYCHVCAEPLRGTARLCDRCWRQPLDIEGVRSVFLMEPPISGMVYSLKYQGVRELAPLLGALLAEGYTRLGLETDVLVPVPLHWRRERQRGYNQSALLAAEAGAILGLPVEANALRRIRSTPQQVRAASGEERRATVTGAFAIGDAAPVTGKRVLLIDDVCTTGATLEACAVALREAGAAGVWALTLAREG